MERTYEIPFKVIDFKEIDKERNMYEFEIKNDTGEIGRYRPLFPTLDPPESYIGRTMLVSESYVNGKMFSVKINFMD